MDLQSQCAPIGEYLQQAKAKTDITYDKIAATVGATSDNVRNLFCGKTAAQNFFFVCSLFKLFNLSIDKYIDNRRAADLPALSDSSPEVMTSDAFRSALQAQIESQQRMIEGYEREIEDWRTHYKELAAQAAKRERTYHIREVVQYVLIFLLAGAFIFLFIYDLLHLDRGWIQDYIAIIRTARRVFA